MEEAPFLTALIPGWSSPDFRGKKSQEVKTGGLEEVEAVTREHCQQGPGAWVPKGSGNSPWVEVER